MQGTEKKNVLSGLIWKFAERCGAQGVKLIVQIILARLLAPDVFGVVALVMVFTEILQVFVDSGLGNALIQKKDADDLDFSTVFYFNLILCIVLYVVIYSLAPFIDNVIYGGAYENLTNYIRVLSLVIVVAGIKNVQQAYVSRTMQFKKFFYATLIGTMSSAVVGIGMALKGFGIWAVIAQHLVSAAIDAIVLWHVVEWRPKKIFSIKRLKELYHFGIKMLASSLLNVVYGKIRQVIIGTYYTSEQLAFYNEGDKIPSVLVNNINTSIDSVLFPAMSNVQEKSETIKAYTRRAIRVSSYIMWPMMLGLSAVATPLIRILLTEKWLPSVFYFQIFCIIYGFQPIQTANLNAIKAMGRSDIFLKLEIVKKIIGFSAMFLTIFKSVEVMACSYLITTVMSAFVNAYPNRKLLQYTYVEQIKDVLPSMLLSVIMFGICYPISFLGMGDLLTIVIQVLVGVSVYILGSLIFKVESFYYILNIIKGVLKGKRR